MRELAPAIVSLHREAHALGGQLLIVYIAEAHAANQWPINSTRCNGPGNTVVTPTSLQERQALAQRMVGSLGLKGVPLMVDGMNDAFLDTYAAWPIRLFGISVDSTLAIIAQPERATFSLPPLRKWLLAECTTHA